MKEIPMPYIKANQVGIVLFVIAAALLKLPLILLVLWFVQVVGLFFGFNLFVRIAKPFLNVKGAETQAVELQRFNNMLAVLFLTFALVAAVFGLTILSYILSVMLFVAAAAAICGYLY